MLGIFWDFTPVLKQFLLNTECSYKTCIIWNAGPNNFLESWGWGGIHEGLQWELDRLRIFSLFSQLSTVGPVVQWVAKCLGLGNSYPCTRLMTTVPHSFFTKPTRMSGDYHTTPCVSLQKNLLSLWSCLKKLFCVRVRSTFATGYFSCKLQNPVLRFYVVVPPPFIFCLSRFLLLVI